MVFHRVFTDAVNFRKFPRAFPDGNPIQAVQLSARQRIGFIIRGLFHITINNDGVQVVGHQEKIRQVRLNTFKNFGPG
jgi:hypothetical protein